MKPETELPVNILKEDRNIQKCLLEKVFFMAASESV